MKIISTNNTVHDYMCSVPCGSQAILTVAFFFIQRTSAQALGSLQVRAASRRLPRHRQTTVLAPTYHEIMLIPLVYAHALWFQILVKCEGTRDNLYVHQKSPVSMCILFSFGIIYQNYSFWAHLFSNRSYFVIYFQMGKKCVHCFW